MRGEPILRSTARGSTFDVVGLILGDVGMPDTIEILPEIFRVGALIAAFGTESAHLAAQPLLAQLRAQRDEGHAVLRQRADEFDALYRDAAGGS